MVSAAARTAGPMLQIGPSLPLAVSVPATLILGGLLMLRLRRVQDASLKFLTLAIWFRFALSAFHQFTFARIAGGFTPNALGSITLFGIGLLLLRRKDLRLPALLPVFGMVAVILLSAVINHRLVASIDQIVKWGYYLVILLLTYRALKVSGEAEVGRMLMWAFSFPIVFQLLSIVLRVAKASEADGSRSWIGGYNHEAAFSVVLAAALFMTCLFRRLDARLRLAGVVYLLAALYLANYRTSIIAAGPLLLVAAPTMVLTLMVSRQRAFTAIVAVFATLVVALTIGALSAERFADVGYLLQHPNEIIRDPNQITSIQRHILSGRLVIWSGYVYGFKQGDALHHLIGFGPDSWTLVFPLYAHNTVISYLFEYGLIGVASILVLWFTMLWASFSAPSGDRGPLLAAHLSFIVLNMATMPHWLIEGNILYGLLCGLTLYKARSGAGARVTAPRSPVPRRRTGALPQPALT